MNILSLFLKFGIYYIELFVPPVFIFLLGLAIRGFKMQSSGADWILALISINMVEIFDYKNLATYITVTKIQKNIVLLLLCILIISIIVLLVNIKLEDIITPQQKLKGTSKNTNPDKYKMPRWLAFLTCWALVVF